MSVRSELLCDLGEFAGPSSDFSFLILHWERIVALERSGNDTWGKSQRPARNGPAGCLQSPPFPRPCLEMKASQLP